MYVSTFDKYEDEDRRHPDYVTEKLTIEVNYELRKRMSELGLTQADLAARLGVSQPQVAKYLSYSSNLTLKSLGALAFGLECVWAPMELKALSQPKFEDLEQFTLRETATVCREEREGTTDESFASAA